MQANEEARLGEAEATVLMMTLLILAGVAVLGMAMHSRRRIRELEHRERLAMIERGLLPAPELDPATFERRSGTALSAPMPPASSRFRSIGVITTGLGLGLMVLITFAADAPDLGLGLGGAIALLGAAFIVNAMLSGRPEAPPPYSYRSERRDPPPDPPR
jgi:hypothetical protein